MAACRDRAIGNGGSSKQNVVLYDAPLDPAALAALLSLWSIVTACALAEIGGAGPTPAGRLVVLRPTWPACWPVPTPASSLIVLGDIGAELFAVVRVATESCLEMTRFLTIRASRFRYTLAFGAIELRVSREDVYTLCVGRRHSTDTCGLAFVQDALSRCYEQ